MGKVESLSCELELPTDWEDRQRASGYLVGDHQDRRRYPRKACHIHAAMRVRKTLPTVRREVAWTRILLLNISRCGAGFLHSEQLFPDEEAVIVFPNGSQRIIKVMRCRRLGPKCFEVGSEFTSAFSELPYN